MNTYVKLRSEDLDGAIVAVEADDLGLPSRHGPDSERGASGAQTASRALRLLKIIARHSPVGVSLTELAVGSGLTRPTVHRLASCLISEGFATKCPSTRRYDLGAGAFQIGVLSSAYSEVQRLCGPVLARVAAITGDNANLVLRTGMDTMSICEVSAPAGVPQMPRSCADPVPIGASPAGVAFLAGFSPGQVRSLLRRNLADSMRRRLTDVRSITAAVDACRRRGYAVFSDPPPYRFSGLAMAVPCGAAPAFLAISSQLGAASGDPERQRFVADVLMREIGVLSTALAESDLI